jgi:hypothetical protein
MMLPMVLATTQCFLLLVPLRHSQALKNMQESQHHHNHLSLTQTFWHHPYMQDPYTAYQYKIKKRNFRCAEHKLHGEEAGAHQQQQLVGKVAAGMQQLR